MPDTTPSADPHTEDVTSRPADPVTAGVPRRHLTWTWRAVAAVAVLVLLVLLVYGSSIVTPYPFLNEEDLVYDANPYLQDLTPANWWELVRQPNYLDFNPVGWTLNFLTVAVVGVDNIAGIRAVSVILHLGVVLLLWRLLTAWLPGRPWLTWAVAAVYAVHPMSVEQALWVPAQKWTLSVLLSLAAMRIWWHARGGTPAGDGAIESAGTRLRPGLVALSLGLFVLALFSKGAAVIVPVLLLSAEWTIGRQRLMRSLWRTAPFFLIAVPFGFIAGSLVTRAPIVDFIGGSRVTSVVSHLPAMTRTIGHWLMPVTVDGSGIRSSLSFFYHVDVVHDATTAGWALASGAVGLLVIAGLWLAAGRSRIATFSALWYLACQALVLGFFAHQWNRMSDRYSCLGGAGLVLLVALAVSRGLAVLGRHSARQKQAAGSGARKDNSARDLAIAVPALALVVLIAANGLTQWMWQTNTNFHWQNLTNEPASPVSLQNTVLPMAVEFHDGLMALPLDRPATQLDVPGLLFSVDIGDPRLSLRVPTTVALLEILATPGAEDLLYFECYADFVMLAALMETRQQAEPVQVQTRSQKAADGPYGDVLLAFAEQHSDRPRVALRAAVYQLCRGRLDLVDRWLQPWRDHPGSAWQRLQKEAASVGPDRDPPNADWFDRHSDYVAQATLKGDYPLFINVTVRLALAHGDRPAALRAIRVARLLNPEAGLFRRWLRQVGN